MYGGFVVCVESSAVRRAVGDTLYADYMDAASKIDERDYGRNNWEVPEGEPEEPYLACDLALERLCEEFFLVTGMRLERSLHESSNEGDEVRGLFWKIVFEDAFRMTEEFASFNRTEPGAARLATYVVSE